MRKIVVVLVGLVMLFSVPAFGEELDFASMTLDELIELRNAVDKAIGERNGTVGQEIGSGQYIVGEDIAVGKYEFVCTLVNVQESASGGKGYNLSRVSLWSELSDAGEELLDMDHFVMDQILKLDLQEGNVLLIKNANFLVRPYFPVLIE